MAQPSTNHPPIKQSIFPMNRPFNLPVVHENHLSTNCQVHVNLKRQTLWPLEKISRCVSFTSWIYTRPSMGRTSGSIIALSLPKILPSSNPFLPKKGTPPRVSLLVTTPARSVGKVLAHWRTILVGQRSETGHVDMDDAIHVDLSKC